MLKQGVKAMLNLFEHCIIPSFFCLVQTLCNLIPRASSLYDDDVKKQKDPGDKFGDLTSSFKTSVDARIEGLASNLDYL